MKPYTNAFRGVRRNSTRTSTLTKSKTIYTLVLTSILLLLSAGLYAQYPWVHQNSGVTANLTAVSFVDSERGFIATEDGDVLHTFNGGVHWHFLSHVDDIVPTRMVFTDYNRGWLTGNYDHVVDSAAVFHTTDGGVTWHQVFGRVHHNLYDIQFHNDTIGWIAGCEISESDTISLMLYTTTEGFSWSAPHSARIHSSLYSIHFRNLLYGNSCGQYGIFFFTNNGGMDEVSGWGTNIAIPHYNKDLYRIFNSGTNYGCAVGEDGFFIVTKDRWVAFTDHVLPSEDNLNAVTGYTNIPQFYAVGNNGCVASIRYALYMWMTSEEARITEENLNDVCQVDDQYAWAVGDNGTILFHTNNNSPVAMDDEASVRQDSSVKIYVLENDTDPDFDPLEIFYYEDGKHGIVTHSDGDEYLEFIPDNDYAGMDTLLYMITDTKKGYDTAYVYIEIREAPTGPFTQVDIPHDTVAFGNAIWGDIDNDDDYDILVAGEQADGTKLSSMYINDEGEYIKDASMLTGVRPGSDQAMAFTDLNMDGYLDFIITGERSSGNPSTRMYLYVPMNFRFEAISTDIPDVKNGSVEWGDIDHDGDPDLLIMGSTESGKICDIYMNNGKSELAGGWDFSPGNKNFHGLDQGGARFVDFNHDQYIDVISTGEDESGNAKTYYYTNQLDLFIVGELEGYKNSTIDICDFNADGNWDLLLTGTMADTEPHATLLTYTDSFSELSSSLSGVNLGSASWGDFDNDGDPDLVICGMNEQLSPETKLYINNSGKLENSEYFLPGMASGSVEWGDYDADGDLDLLMSGYYNTEPNRITTIFMNYLETTNQPPEAPEQFNTEYGGGEHLKLMWSSGSDAESSSANLDYNYKIKRKRQRGNPILPASNDPLISEIPGYASTRDTMILLSGLQPGALYEIEIQTVDAGFHVSPWAKFEFSAPSLFLWEQDFDVIAHELMAAEWFYRENDTLPALLLSDIADSSSYLIQWNGSEFDTLYRDLILGSGHGQVALMDFNMDNIVDFSEIDNSASEIVIYISGGDTLRVPIANHRAIYDWGDYDQDGDPDLVMTDIITDEAHYVSIYRNDRTEMDHISTLIPGVMDGDIAWVDIDSDGDLDVAVTGRNKDLDFITSFAENRDGAFFNIEMDLPGLWYSSFDFADYDGDGDMDMLLCGRSGPDPMTKIYANNGGIFSETSHGLAPVERGSCKWVDLGNNRRDDIVLLGYPESDMGSSRNTAIVYLEYDGEYHEAAKMESVPGPILATGDYDDDGYTDLAFAGSKKGSSALYIYRNLCELGTKEPYLPKNFSVKAFSDSVTLIWNYPIGIDPTDDRVMFNLRVGSQPGAHDILSPLADETGKRKVFHPGNVPAGTSWTLRGLSPDSTYYTAIQSVSPSFHGSAFSEEIVFNSVSGTLLPEVVLYSSGLQMKNADWVDIDSDRDPDLLMIQGNSIVSYENIDGSLDFENLTHHFDAQTTSELLVNDYDNDNDVDVLLLSSTDPSANQMLVNESGVYSASPLDLDGLYNANAALGDLNNDGRMDIVIMGTEEPSASPKSLVYVQNEEGFESLDNLLVPTYNGEIHMVDIDSEGDLDLVRCGLTGDGNQGQEETDFIINLNNEGAFIISPNGANFPGLNYCNMAFGDYYDNGQEDMLISGSDPKTGRPRTLICKRISYTYIVQDSLVPVYNASAKWFDFNNDKLLDIVLSGYNDTDDHIDDPDVQKFSGVFLNRDGSFELVAKLATFIDPVIAVADYDMDGRQDIFIGGHSSLGDTLGILYRNTSPEINLPPPSPSLTSPYQVEGGMEFYWRPKGEGSNYNMRLGTEPGSGDVISPLSHADGTRKVYNSGNMQRAHRYTIRGLDPAKTYYVAVQAIDECMTPSGWSDEISFTTVDIDQPRASSSLLELEIYPVPAKEEVFLRLRNVTPGLVELEVINQLGRVIYSASEESQTSEHTFRLSLPDNGLYVVKLRSGKELVTGKIVVLE